MKFSTGNKQIMRNSFGGESVYKNPWPSRLRQCPRGTERSFVPVEPVALRMTDYPHAQATLKNSVSSLTQTQRLPFETKGWQPQADGVFEKSGKEYGTQYHKQMQHLSPADLEALIPEIRGYEIHREIPFLQFLNRDGADIIVQGVVDLLALKDNNAIIIDYKTTRAPAEKLIELYKPQLDMYAAAVSQAFKPKQISIYIYSSFNQTLVRV